jgi:hypothetical protein
MAYRLRKEIGETMLAYGSVHRGRVWVHCGGEILPDMVTYCRIQTGRKAFSGARSDPTVSSPTVNHYQLHRFRGIEPTFVPVDELRAELSSHYYTTLQSSSAQNMASSLEGRPCITTSIYVSVQVGAHRSNSPSTSLMYEVRGRAAVQKTLGVGGTNTLQIGRHLPIRE